MQTPMMPLLSLAAPDRLQGFRPTHEAAIGFALIGLYYLIVWLAVGSDPEQGTIVISYEPPEGLSPATLRYLCKKGFDEKGFTSALLDVAAKNFVEIEPCGDFYRLNRGTADASVLSAEEKTLTDILMRRGFSFDLKEESQHRVNLAIQAMPHTLDRTVTKTYFAHESELSAPWGPCFRPVGLLRRNTGQWEKPDSVMFMSFCPTLSARRAHALNEMRTRRAQCGLIACHGSAPLE